MIAINLCDNQSQWKQWHRRDHGTKISTELSQWDLSEDLETCWMLLSESWRTMGLVSSRWSWFICWSFIWAKCDLCSLRSYHHSWWQYLPSDDSLLSSLANQENWSWRLCWKRLLQLGYHSYWAYGICHLVDWLGEDVVDSDLVDQLMTNSVHHTSVLKEIHEQFAQKMQAICASPLQPKVPPLSCWVCHKFISWCKASSLDFSWRSFATKTSNFRIISSLLRACWESFSCSHLMALGTIERNTSCLD